MLKIDESNFNYLVRIVTEYYVIRLYYGLPKKSSKGYVGINHKSEEKKFKNRDDALLQFANWKEDYIGKYYREELVYLYINYYPFTCYYVTCPKCGKDAEIISWIGCFGYGEDEFGIHSICCKHCAESLNFEDVMDNRVGTCNIALMRNEEELNIRLQHCNGIKWEEFLEKGFYKDK